MKIAIIGKGTSAIIQACVFLLNKNFKIEIFYDPDVPPISVGESTTPHFPNLLEQSLGLDIDHMIDNALISRKRGVTFINWGNGTPWVHGFGGSPPDANSGVGSFHFDTVILNKYLNGVLEEKGVTYHAEKVTKMEEIGEKVFLNDREYDFVVNCTGWNYDKSLAITPLFHTVNAAYLYRDDDFSVADGLEARDLTVHRATEDGWEFNLPFPLENTMRKGYLFNTNYISEEEVIKKLESKGKKGKIFKWQPKRSRHMLESKRVGANGNRLFFNEPLQAYSVLLYIELAYHMLDYVNGKINSTARNAYNLRYRRLLISYEQELAFHYQYGSTFKDSKFWQDKTKEARDVMYYHPSGSIEDLDSLLESEDLNSKGIQRIFMHSREDMLYVHRWMLDKWTDEERPKIRWSNQ